MSSPWFEPDRDLTQREIQILKLAALGLSDQAIADRLYLTKGTVNNYMQDIFDVLRLLPGHRRRAAAVVRAIQLGVITADEVQDHQD